MKVIALITAGFLFLTTLESWAFIWIAGRWFMSSRHGSITLGTVKRWLDKGLITRTTNQVKIFVNKNGKWIILTVGLSTVLPEVLRRIEAMQYCYALHDPTGAYAVIQSYSSRVRVSYDDSPRVSQFWTYDYSCDGYSRDGSDPNSVRFPLYYVYRLEQGRSGMSFWTYLPAEGTYTLRSRDRNPVTCTVTIRWLLPLRECNTPEDRSWENERRDVPVRIYPNPLDFIRPDIVENDPALRYLRDEYNRIANDASIPNVSSDLVGLSLPQIGWNIPPEEAIDSDAESSERPRPSTASSDRPADSPDIPRNEDRPRDEDLPSPPGFDTSLPSLEKRSFPVGLINNLIENHPLFRILHNVQFDAGSGGSCEIGSGTFRISFCEHAWVLNLMGAIIVPIAFLIGLFGWRND
jgi:hypothetical protein